MFPDELRPFPFDEQQYLRSTMKELRRRQAMGVDVCREMAELLDLCGKVSIAEGGVRGAGEEWSAWARIRPSENSPGPWA